MEYCNGGDLASYIERMRLGPEVSSTFGAMGESKVWKMII